MTGFSPAWLALREPADLAARNAGVLQACAQAFAHRQSMKICDLGAGTGASLRAFSPLLPAMQRWTLVDHDRANLAALEYSGDRTHVTVETLVHDLAAQPACWPADVDLVTTSALFDLTSEEWIARLVRALAADRVPVLATLTFDGGITIDPPHPLDADVAAAFRAHQARDKGFGPAAGPKAADFLISRLQDSGYQVTAGDSPWRLDRTSEALVRQTVEGIAAAASETGLVPDIDQWRRDRLVDIRVLMIGHRDVFARYDG